MDEINGGENLIKLSFTGDITCDRPLLNAAKITEKEYNFKELFENVKEIFSSSFVIGNLETIFAGENFGYNPGYISYNSPDILAREMRNAGINMVSTANNHCADCGLEGIKRTINILDYNDIMHTGTISTRDEKRYIIVDINDVKIAFVAYTYPLNINLLEGNNNYINLISQGEYAGLSKWKKIFKKNIPHNVINIIIKTLFILKCKKGKTVINPYIDDYSLRDEDNYQIENTINVIKKAKSQADFVFLSLHQGGQFNPIPGMHSRQLCDVFLPYVDAIIGNHPHLVQCIKIKKNKPVAYSLGSFNLSMSADYVTSKDLPNYSILLNFYLNKITKKLEYVTFTILSAIEDANHYVRVYPIDSLFVMDLSDEKKQQLRNEALIIYNRFTGKSEDDIDICREYFLR